jgi:hypothetical protein
MMQAGVILSDYATLMVEILKDNSRPEASEVYGTMDVAWAKLVGQIAQAPKVNERECDTSNDASTSRTRAPAAPTKGLPIPLRIESPLNLI